MHLNRHALKVIRDLKRLTVTDLATACEIRQPHLSNIEAGRRRASPELIDRFAAVLGVPIEAICLTAPEPLAKPRTDVKKTAA